MHIWPEHAVLRFFRLELRRIIFGIHLLLHSSGQSSSINSEDELFGLQCDPQPARYPVRLGKVYDTNQSTDPVALHGNYVRG